MSRIEPIYTCPAFDVLPAPRYREDESLIVLKYKTKVACKLPNSYDPVHHELFTVGTLRGYREGELAPGQTYEQLEEEAVALHGAGADVWINKNAVSISASKQAREYYREIKIGDRVLIDGRTFTVEETHNGNLKLVEFTYTAPEA